MSVERFFLIFLLSVYREKTSQKEEGVGDISRRTCQSYSESDFTLINFSSPLLLYSLGKIHSLETSS